MAHLTRPAEISGVSAGLFPVTAAGNRALSVHQVMSKCCLMKRLAYLTGLGCSKAD